MFLFLVVLIYSTAVNVAGLALEQAKQKGQV